MNVLPSIYPVACHTDNVGTGSTFVAVAGMKEDGCSYIPTALEKGATTIVVDAKAPISAQVLALIEQKQATLVTVDQPRKALAQLSAKAWGFPADKLIIVGITGTKGKTTTTFLTHHLLVTAGYSTALLSTVHNRITILANGLKTETIFSTALTTQHPDYLHMFLAHCVNLGVTHVVMEVAAQALSLWRVEGISFDAVLFTNFAQEHGEFYPTMDEYFHAKCRIFDHVKDRSKIFLNVDDPTLHQLIKSSEQEQFSAYSTTGFDAHALVLEHIRAQVIKSDRHGIILSVDNENSSHDIHCPSLLGSYNASNMLGAVTLARACGVAYETIQKAFLTFTGVPGRLESYRLPNQSLGIIDYAHNPSSFQALLPMLRTISDHLIVVFGCGGEREASKRPIMGAIAAEIADLVILTTDNPRSEDPAIITQQIYAGVPAELRAKVIVELDREKAIQLAYAQAKPNSIVALLGKGPEEYQVVGVQKVPFSERKILQSL
jgi:UDP-N-acetylmuramoyl-L-alanyl-D-glutamate--2,6-diaminopimelate ligase